MFLKISLKELHDENSHNLHFFSDRQKGDLQMILDEMEKEELSIFMWSIHEIVLLENSTDTFVYCMSAYNGQEVDIFISESGGLEPHYFKFLDEENYRAEKADNIQQAIEQNRINQYKYEDYLIQKLYQPVAQRIVKKMLEKETTEQINNFKRQLKINNLGEYIFHFTDYEPDHENDDYETLISKKGNENLKYSRLERTVLSMLSLDC